MSAAIDNIKSSYIQSQNIPQKKLSAGNEVSVKVIKNLGNGNYTVFLQGAKINVKSKIPLAEGNSFKATLEIRRFKNHSKNTFRAKSCGRFSAHAVGIFKFGGN